MSETENVATEEFEKTQESADEKVTFKSFMRGKNLAYFITACFFGLMTLIVFISVVAYHWYELSAFIVLFFTFTIDPAVVFMTRFACTKKGLKRPALFAPLFALSCDLLIVAAFLGGYPFEFFIIFPFVGVLAAGSYSIADRKHAGKTGLGIGIGSFAAPFVAIAVFLLLLSTRVIVISWM